MGTLSNMSLQGASASDVKLASDGRNLDALKRDATSNPKGAAKEAAKQFESLFMSELLKSMRAATENSGLLGIEHLGTQLAAKTAGRPGGLSEVIEKQLERQMGLVPGPIPSTTRANESLPTVQDATSTPKVPEKSAAGFVRQHTAAAENAAADTGIPAPFMLAQAALETGWGKREIIGRDGTNSHNLFGIKAGGSWNGPTVEVTTTEYISGQPRKMIQKFRAYASESESFADYARLMKDSPRYAKVVERAADAKAFAMGLQKAGYATDPLYGQKLGQVINTTLRLQRDMA